MIRVRKCYVIPLELDREAMEYAAAARAYTADRHDFHPGGLENKQQKMYEGKLGEKAFKMFLWDNGISFEEDHSPCTEADEYDFLLANGKKVDVKTRTKAYHSRTLEMVEEANCRPKDIYISARLYKEDKRVILLGWFTRQDMLKAKHIQNNGYQDNYAMYDNELRPMRDFGNIL